MRRIIIFFLWAFICAIQVNCQDVDSLENIRPDRRIHSSAVQSPETTEECPLLKCTPPPFENCETLPTFFPLNNKRCSGCPHYKCEENSANELSATEDSEQKLAEECPLPNCESLQLPAHLDVDRDCTVTKTYFETLSGKTCTGCPIYECKETAAVAGCPVPKCDELAFPPEVNVERDCNITYHSFQIGDLNCEGCPIYECRIPPNDNEEKCPDTYCALFNLPRGLAISDCVKTPTFFQLNHLTCEGCPTYSCSFPSPSPLLVAAQEANEDTNLETTDSSSASSRFSLSAGAALGIGIVGGFVVAIIVAVGIIALTKKNKNYNEIL